MQIETVRLETTDGVSLDGDVFRPDGQIRAAVVVAHPHPRFGGDRYNPVVDTIVRALSANGVLALRFDFRGVNASGGRQTGGVNEHLDVAAAVDHLSALAVPIVVVGYSFGSLMALRCVDPRIAGWCAIAPPLRADAVAPESWNDDRPKLLLVPANDQFATPAAVDSLTRSWHSTVALQVDNADHFLGGQLSYVAGQVGGFVAVVTGTAV